MSRSIQHELELERTMHNEAKKRLANQNKELEALRNKLKETANTSSVESVKTTSVVMDDESSAVLKNLMANLEHGILVLDENKKIITVNEIFCERFELKTLPEALKGTDGIKLITHIRPLFKNPDQFVSKTEKILQDKRSLVTDELSLANGQICSCEYIPVFSKDTFKGFILKFKDITRTKTISDTFDTQRRFYEQILNNIPADIVVLTSDGRYLFVNPVAIDKPDLRKWMIGKTMREFYAFTEKPATISEHRLTTFRDVVLSKTKKEWEEKLTDASGNAIYHLRILYPVLDSRGEVGIVIGYGVDITERKKIEEEIQLSEEKYRGIIENMSLGMIEMDNDERIVYANQRFCAMSGYKFDELISRKATELFLHGASLKMTRAQLSKRQYGIVNSYELAISDKKGKEHWWLTSATPIFDALDNQKGTISIHLDITEQKKLEDQLRVAKYETEKSSMSKDIFLTNMSHEIRTPLNAIMGLGKLLSKSDLNTQQKNYLNGIESASSNLLGIINDLLDISKIEAGKITIEHISFNLETILQQAVNVLEHNADEKGLSLTHEIDHRISPVLVGDPFRLNQVFMNMISNAIKFTEKGSVSLRAFLLGATEESQKILVAIVDTGVGIKEEYLNTIFDKFTQEDETVVRKFGGTGLGMSITKQLMELMGGSISIESKKNVGTTISLIFDFKIGTARVFEKKRTIKNDTYNINDKRILLVEDNSLNRLLANTILTEYGAKVVEAENGAIAVALMRTETFDMVLMDIQMPVMDGIQATKIIRKEINKTIPILALTANAIKSQEEQFIKAGMNDLISKPYNEINLVNPIAKWLNDNAQAKSQAENVKLPPPKTEPPGPPAVTTVDELFDISKLLSIARGDAGFINKMLQLFIVETPPAIAKIKEGFQKGDMESVKYYAHRIKPSYGNLGINSLKEEILKIELSTERSAELETLINKLDTVTARVVEQIKQAYPGINK
jgi:PAS domain S-box-containing protein